MMIRKRDIIYPNYSNWILLNFLVLFVITTTIYTTTTVTTAAKISWNQDQESDDSRISSSSSSSSSTSGNLRHLRISSRHHNPHQNKHHHHNANNDDGNDYDNDDHFMMEDFTHHHHKNNSNYHDILSILPSWVRNENFILTDYLTDGELERRISYDGITAKETSIGYNSSDLLSLWQVTDGKRFIQLIYSNGRDLIDCEYIHEKNLIKKFLHDFYTEIDLARSRNFTLPIRQSSTTLMIKNQEFNNVNVDAPSDMDNIVQHHRYHEHNDDNNNREFFNGMTPAIQEYSSDYEYNDDGNAFGMRNLSYKRIERYEDIPEEIRHSLNYNELKLQCSRRHQQMKAIVQGLNSDDENVRRDAKQRIQRQKRDLSDWLIAPNTKWCGRGHNAGKYSQLGGASRADKCCRKHDYCKINIKGLTTKWQVFNYFPFTISHCSCDMRFRTCLKMADSSDANMVGKLFFNIVQTKCFVLKTEKVCKKRSWWGKCEKRVRRKRAHLRDNRKF